MVAVAALSRNAASVFADDHGRSSRNHIGRQRREAIELVFCPAEFDRDVLTLDEACFLQALTKRRQILGIRRLIAAVE